MNVNLKQNLPILGHYTYSNLSSLIKAKPNALSLVNYLSEMNKDMKAYLDGVHQSLSQTHSISTQEQANLKNMKEVLKRVNKEGMTALREIYKEDEAFLQSIDALHEQLNTLELQLKDELKLLNTLQTGASVDQVGHESLTTHDQHLADRSSPPMLKDLMPRSLADINAYSAKTYSKGPSFLDKVYSVASTVKKKVKDIFRKSPDLRDIKNANIKAAVTRLSFEGKQMSNSVVLEFLNILKKDANVDVIDSFMGNRPINAFTKQEVLDVLSFARQCAPATVKKDDPICIPIVLGKSGLFERRHITVILIQNGEVQYYDSKGVPSDKHLLKDGSSLRDVLNSCGKTLLDDPDANVIENNTVHQYDVHRCGLFVMFYLYNVLIKGERIKSFENKEIPVSFLDHFRKALIPIFKDYDKMTSNHVPAEDLPKVVSDEEFEAVSDF